MSTDQVKVRRRHEGSPHRLRDRQLPVPRDEVGRRRPVLHRRGQRPQQGRPGQAHQRFPVRIHLPQLRAALHDPGLLGQPRLAGSRDSSSSSTRSTSTDGEFNFLGLRFSGPHPSAGVDACAIVAPLVGIGLGQPSDPASRRLDELPDGLLRVPAAELPRERGEEPAAPRLQRLRRERRRLGGAAAEPPEHRHPAVHQHRRLADRPAARRARHAALRGAARLRLLVVRRPAVGRLVQHAASSTTAAMRSRRSAPRPTRSTTSSATPSPTTTSTRSACTSPGCRAARTASGSTSRSTTPRCRWPPPCRSPAMPGPHGRRATAASGRRRSGRSTASSTTS